MDDVSEARPLSSLLILEKKSRPTLRPPSLEPLLICGMEADCFDDVDEVDSRLSTGSLRGSAEIESDDSPKD